MLDFPSANLQVGQLFPDPVIAGVPLWMWDGEKWITFSEEGGANILVEPTAPLDVPDNTLWWSSTEGRLYLLYNDSNSVQWVAASPVERGPQGMRGPQGLRGPEGPPFALSYMFAGLTANVPFATAWIDLLTLDVGGEGTWFVIGTASVSNGSNASHAAARLISAATPISMVRIIEPNPAWINNGTCSGVVVNPAAPIRLQVIDDSANATAHAFPVAGGGSATHMTAIRIA